MTDKNLEILGKADKVDCSDQWSIVDTNIAIEQQKESSSILLKSNLILGANFLMVFLEFLLY